MSKFDKLFNKASANANAFANANTGSFVIKPNSFIIKDLALVEAKAKINFDYKEEAFPDLVSSNKTIVNTSAVVTKKYSDIASTVAEVKKFQEENPVPPGWTGFTRSKGNWKFDIVHGEKTQRQLEQEQEKAKEDEILNDPSYTHNQMITALVKNWSRYKIQYDSIHGEGAYDMLYYSDTVYSDDEYLSDEASNYDNIEYSNDTE
jgi:hypothetical protein